MNEKEERAYLQGKRAAQQAMLRSLLLDMGLQGRDQNAWAIERAEAISALRNICRNHGDNDWDDDLSLADVIEKHLAKHLED